MSTYSYIIFCLFLLISCNQEGQDLDEINAVLDNQVSSWNKGDLKVYMQGYWNDPERTADTIDAEGWLHSGDLGEMDEDGFVKITGRIKDMIIRGGENVYPREIEEFLYTHPDIQEIQVFGVPDAKYGEQVAAWIQLKEGVNLSEDGIRQFCSGQITHFKIPKYIKMVHEFPMTVTGKMQKFVMRDAFAKELGL